MDKREHLEQYAHIKLHEMRFWEKEYRAKMIRLLERQGIPLNIESLPQILHTTSFSRIKRNPNASACPYYKQDTGCCKDLEINCFLCACPEYDSKFVKVEDSEEVFIGRCKRQSRLGEYSNHPHSPNIHIWDCSACPYPHLPETVVKYLREHMQELQEQSKSLCSQCP